MNTTPFSVLPSSDPSVYSSFIPSIHTKPVKFSGCIIDGSLTDRKSIEELEAKLLAGLKDHQRLFQLNPETVDHATPFDT